MENNFVWEAFLVFVLRFSEGKSRYSFLRQKIKERKKLMYKHVDETYSLFDFHSNY